LRNNWQEARAMLVPPEKNSASTTLMRRPSRPSLVLTSIGVVVFGKRNMSTVSRAGTKSSEPWRCSITWASRPITTRPCRELGSHGPFETGVGMKTSLMRSCVKKGWFFVMARDHGGFHCVKSRAGDLLIPHGEEALLRRLEPCGPVGGLNPSRRAARSSG
jgi:hypothetical protein